MDKEFLFRELLNSIRGLNCHFNYHQLHEFLTNDEQGEFRLSGKFGFGFKLYKSHNQYVFGQYPEHETVESKKWIKDTNEKITQFISQNN